MERDAVAKTILKQLGGNKFLAMTGAKDLFYDEKSLTFKLPKNNGKIFAYRIELDYASDTYKLTKVRKSGKFDFDHETTDGVYCEMLREIIKNDTGFALNL